MSEQRWVSAVAELATPGPAAQRTVGAVGIRRYDTPGGETWLQIEGPRSITTSVVNYFGYDYHVIGLAAGHIVLLVTPEAAASHSARMEAERGARVATS